MYREGAITRQKCQSVCERGCVCVCVPDRPTDARLLFLQKYNVFDRSVKSSALC